MKSIFKEEITGRGTGCTGAGAIRVFTFCVRYQVIIFGTRRGPTVKQRVLRVAVLTMTATTLAVLAAGY